MQHIYIYKSDISTFLALKPVTKLNSQGQEITSKSGALLVLSAFLIEKSLSSRFSAV